MIVGPGDEKAAAAVANRQPRASRADRRESADVLKAAFALGWLAKDEFDTRIGQVRASRTYAELAAVTADVPGCVSGARTPSHLTARRRPAQSGRDR